VSRGVQGLHVRRRGGRLAVEFRSSVLESAPAQPAIRVLAADGRLIVRGTLSSGSCGWLLSARASCFRRTIKLEITAMRGPLRPVAGVEDHGYEAVIRGAGVGRYLLRVSHVWLLSRDTGEMLVMPAYEGPVTFAPQPEP
jgi:hypothetical protein